MSKKKIFLVIGICILIISVIILVFILNKVQMGDKTNNPNLKFSKTQGLNVVTTMNDEIKEDTIWCGTFQLIWNDLKNEIIKTDIKFTPQLQMVENLNKSDFNAEMLSEQSYYKKYGMPNYELKEEIEKAIKDKFNETSDILNDFNWNSPNPKDYFLYVMLKKEFEFISAFDKLDNGKFKDKYENISYFGINENSKEELREQIRVLYYNSNKDFAILINTKQNDEVILCRTEQNSTFNQIYENMNKKTSEYEGNSNFSQTDVLKVPNIKFKEKVEFNELERKEFPNYNGEIYIIEKALQTIEFELDETGGKIKSEAGIMARNQSAAIVGEKREFLFNDTFILFLREEGREKPYFAAKIDDITKFQ